MPVNGETFENNVLNFTVFPIYRCINASTFPAFDEDISSDRVLALVNTLRKTLLKLRNARYLKQFLGNCLKNGGSPGFLMSGFLSSENGCL